MRHLTSLFGLLSFASCHSGPSPDAPVGPSPVAPPSTASVVVLAPSASATSRPAIAYAVPATEELSLAWLVDRTLVVVTREWIATRDREGKTAYRALAKGETVNLGSADEGLIVWHSGGACTLLKTPSLEKIASGQCSTPMRDWGAVVITDAKPKPVLAFQKNGTVFRVPLPGNENSFVAIEPSASGKSVVLTRPDASMAQLIRTDTGALLANVPAPHEYSGSLSMSSIQGESLFVVHGDTVGQYDMSTGGLVRQMAVGCKRQTVSAANLGSSVSSMPPPPAAPDTFDISTAPHSLFVANQGARIALVCKGDLLVFGNWKLEGRIPRVEPGCDNIGLPAEMSADGKQLTPMGCGGIARIELASRRYLCADSDGIAGGRYAMVPGTDTRAPFGRKALPRCSKAPDGVLLLGGDGAPYWLDTSSDVQTVFSASAAQPQSFTLEPGAANPVWVGTQNAPEIAYPVKDEVVGRRLPDGQETFRWKLGQQ